MKRRIFISLCMAVLACVTVKAEDLAYTTNNDGTLTITGFASDFTQQDNYTLVIPDEINGKAVTAISAGAFKGKTNFTSLTIGRNVKSIGNKAFESCTALTGVVIPNTVTFIGEDVFYNCTGMTEASFEDGYALDYIPMWMFDNTAISTITIPPSVKDIQQGAFKNCSKLTSIVIPSNVTTLGKEAFMNCPLLTEVTIPSTITSMDASVFYSCGIETATVACETIGAGAFDGCNKLTTLNLMDGVKTIKKEAFYGCSKLTTVSIPSSVTTMEESAFHSCLLLATVNFADGIKLETIPDYAFYKSGLTSIAIPVSVKTIGNYAFQECNKLTNVIFPENTQVTTINDRAFSSCALLPSFTMPNSVTTLGSGVFSSCSKLASVTFSNQLTAIPYQTFYYCTSLNNVTIPRWIKTIGNQAFMHCTSLSSIIIPNTLTSIGEDVFWECTGMTEASFEDGYALDYIPKWMFENTAISTITIPPSVKDIQQGAFKNCSKLTSIVIPSNVTTLGKEAFMNCPLLTEVTIPSTITSMDASVFYSCGIETATVACETIGAGAFDGCNKLTTLNLMDGVKTIKKEAFYGCSKLTTVSIPSSVTTMEESAFHSCLLLATVNFADGIKLETIPDYAFYKSGLTSIAIPVSVKTIGNYAFQECNKLTHIEIPATVHTINGEAFMSCERLESITLPSSIGYMGNSLFNGDNSLQFIDVSQCVNVYDLYKNISSLRNGIFYGVPTSTKIIMPPYSQATLGDNDEVATLEFDLEQVDGYYLINSAADWDKFVVYSRANPEVNGRLTKDINLDGHDGKLGVGNDFSNNIPYQGTFDGQYFTISVNYQANKDYTGGLFSWVKNATIKQLTVSGAIETSHHYTGGFIGGIVTALTMNDCESRVIMTINGSTSNTLCIGGFIGHSGDRNAVNLTDCLFSGTINDNTNKGYVAPFTAYTSSSYNAVYTNCLNNGTFNTNPSSTIVLWDGSKATFSNCYYTAGNYSSDYVYGTSVSAYQLAQGEIAFNLQGDRTEQHWGQVIGTDLAPVLTNDPNKWVYKINEYKYSNNPNDSGILTGISHAEQSSMAEGQNDEWFTPEGQKLNGRPTAKGIYIRNGRKVILK